jgi:hypothetical protein
MRTSSKLTIIFISIIIILTITGYIYIMYFFLAPPEIKSFEIDLDQEYGIKLNFNRLNLSEEAIENISSSKFFIIIDLLDFKVNKTYSFKPNLTGIDHPISSDQRPIRVDDEKKFERLKNYSFEVHFKIESDNNELKNLTLLDNTNSIYGILRFDDSSAYLDLIDDTNYIQARGGEYNI